jgi:hypothetical protein
MNSLKANVLLARLSNVMILVIKRKREIYRNFIGYGSEQVFGSS